MGLFAMGAIFGTGFGPFWAGFVEGNPALQWRWIQYIQAIYTGAGFIVLAIFLKETRGSVLLTRKAARLRRETGDQRYRAKAEEERASIPILIKNSLTRPLKSRSMCKDLAKDIPLLTRISCCVPFAAEKSVLFSEPIVTVFSLWIAFVWGEWQGPAASSSRRV
jgi:MFS family permease